MLKSVCRVKPTTRTTEFLTRIGANRWVSLWDTGKGLG